MIDKVPANYREEVKRQLKEVVGVKRPPISALKYLMDIQDKYIQRGLNHITCLSCILKTIQNFKTLVAKWEK